MTNEMITIDVQHVYKDFRIYKDKSHTFKDRVLFHKRNSYVLNHVLRDVSFQVEKGQAIGLIGHNGCGKSTTLKLLNKILYPDRGAITMRGRISSLIELGAGFHPDMTGRENIYINASIFGLKKREIDCRLENIIRFSELEEFIDNPVRTYSSGMYMRLAFAIAINVDADILLIDEILAVGDVNFQKKCFEKLQEIKKNGTTIVIVSHSMDQVRDICDRVIWLDNGIIKEYDDANIVCQKYLLEMRKNSRKRELIEKGIDPLNDPMEQYPITKVTKNPSQYAYRNGNMKIRFSHVEIIGREGSKNRCFQCNDSFEILYSIETNLNTKLDECTIIFNIFNFWGALCATIDSSKEFRRVRPIEELKNGDLQIVDLPLVEGIYILAAIIRDKTGEDCDCLGHLIEFQVGTRNDSTEGIVSLKCKWNLA